MTLQQTHPNPIGINWVSNIPKHWRILKLRSILKHVSMKNKPNLPLLSITRERGIILRDVSSKEENHNYIPDDLTNYKVVSPGQFGINKMKAWQGSYGVSTYHGIISPAYYTFNLTGVTCDFFHLAIRSKAYIPFFTQASDGVRVGQWDLSLTRMKEIPFFIPPEHEQRKIDKVINLVNLKINKFIQKKKRLIELLKEQKQAIINQAVTRGLDPNVRLKPSGVEWLGDIPEHWEILPIKRIVKTKMTDGPHETPELLEEGVPFVSADAIKNGKVLLPRKRGNISAETHQFYCRKIKPQKDDIFIVKSGSTTGKIGIVDFDDEFSIWSPLALVRVKNTISPRLVYHALSSKYFQQQVKDRWSFGTQPNIGMGILQNLLIALPPCAREQAKILNHLENKSFPIDSMISKINREIDLIQEYRTRLISDVVTGQIDVRNIEIGDIVDEKLIEEPLEEEQEEESLELVGVSDDD